MSRLSPRFLAGAAALGLGYALVGGTSAFAQESAVHAPAPALTVPAGKGQETAVFAGGCFWGVQGVFAHVKGVTSAVSGYTGGSGANAHYDRVAQGDTGHAESVRVTFDPRQVSYADLLRVYFSVVADPTQLNAQGPDEGTQYRSALFPTNPAQAKVAQAYLGQLKAAKLWKQPIVTRIEPARPFFAAEGYHQNYLTLHPDAGYIRINDLPKVAALKQMYPKLYREKPVLVEG
jgi:peptide-methionine (S)-S-oxide reductase